MKIKECINPSDTLTIVKNRNEVEGCVNCVIPQILRVPCLSLQITARKRAALNCGMGIRPNPDYPGSSVYPTIAVCRGNRAIAISTETGSQILRELNGLGIKIREQEPSSDDYENRNQI